MAHPKSVQLHRFLTEPYPCSYLPAQTARLDYRIVAGLRAEDYGALLRRGWRRFGNQLFRPACPRCSECRSLRIPVADFRPSRGQRRNPRGNAGVRVVVRRPTLTPDHLRLYDAYHRDMHRRRGWPLNRITAEEYEQTFLRGGGEGSREFVYLRGAQMIGVGLADVVEDALSSVYFFHAPEWRPAGPGVFSILEQLRFCREQGLRYQYLGYWIPGCPSMSYKSRFRPHEVLVGSPDDHEAPRWIPGAPRSRGCDDPA
ncbi:MAG: arginyltransferase [Planctomycetota bacterium]